jgi:hypothetical protein
MDEIRHAHKIFVGKPERKRPFDGPAYGNIKMDIKEVEWKDVNQINLAQDRDQWRSLVNTVMNLRVP